MKKCKLLLLIILLVITLLPSNVVYAKENDDTIHISTVEDWNNLAKECHLDVYSKDKKVSIDEDLIFDNNFDPISYFNGELIGNDHTIKIKSIDTNNNIDGIIRITGESALITNLNIEYALTNDYTRVGFVGYNQGTIKNITAKANLEVNDVCGIIAGYNSLNGLIKNCTVDGLVNGKHYIGGIVGQNYGRILYCRNRANLDIVIEDDLMNIEDLTLSTITESENIASITDIGGIAGINFGTIISCVNHGIIGHEHYGYNIGGICGSSSGYVKDAMNYGTVSGRKEVGGIVGQMEPAMNLIFTPDYIQKMRDCLKEINETCDKTVSDLKESTQESSDLLSSMSNSLQEAYNATEVILNSRDNYKIDGGKIVIDDDGSYANAKTTLSSSMSNFFNTFNALINAYDDNTNGLADDLQELSDETNELSNLAVDYADYLNSEKEMYVDVSEQADESDTEGKVFNAVNYGSVSGDINVGGIAGALAKENDLDPEDDFDITGALSSQVQYEIKGFAVSSRNEGDVTASKKRCGGILGYESFGIVKDSICLGIIHAEDADYVGGIVGEASAAVNNNYAKCFIYGADYVGGICGSALKAKNNGSLAQIMEANSNVGAVLGNYEDIESTIVENATDIEKNFYVYDELAAVDDISYASKAYKITYDEFKEKKVDDVLKETVIYFVDEDHKLISKKIVDYGSSLSLDNFPSIDEEEYQYGAWENYDEKDFKNICKDMIVVKEYNDIIPSISSEEEPLALIVAYGKFYDDDQIHVLTTETVKDDDNQINSIIYTIYSDISDDSEIKEYCLYTNEYEEYTVYSLIDNEWQLTEYTVDGSYVHIDYASNLKQVKIVEKPNYKAIIIISIVIILLPIAILLIKKKKSEKSKKTVKEQ